jgi:hypothetical protein
MDRRVDHPPLDLDPTQGDVRSAIDAPPEIDLDELTRLALGADPDAPLTADAVPLAVHLGRLVDATSVLLPAWYMPAPGGAVRQGRRWRRVAAIVAIAAFTGINATGLCSTYGWVSFG